MSKSLPTGLCERATPVERALATIVSTNGSSKFGYIRSGFEVSACLSSLKDFIPSPSKIKVSSFCSTFFNRLDVLARLDINRL